MTFELIPGTTNVYRFPVEDRARPTLDLLRRIRPDLRALGLVAEFHGLEPPAPDDRDRAAAEAAALVASATAPLEPLVADRIGAAVAACRAALRQASTARYDERRLTEAKAAGGYWLAPLEARAAEGARQAARLALAAHARAEAAEALARAARLARLGRPVAPPDRRAEAEELFFGGRETVRA